MYLSDAIMQPDPHMGGAKMTVEQMLEGLLTQLDNTPDELPEVEAEIRGSAGEMYLNQGDVDRALPQLRRACDMYELFGPEVKEHGFTLNALGLCYYMVGAFEEAEIVQRKCVSIMRSQPPEIAKDIDMTIYLGNLAASLIRREKYAEAEAMLQDVITQHVENRGPDSIYVIANVRKLADVFEQQGLWDRALETLESILPTVRESFEPSHPVYASTIGDLGQLLMRLESYDEALPLFEERWELAQTHRRVGGNDWMYALEDYCDLLEKMDEPQQATDLLDHAIRVLIDNAGEEHTQVAHLRQRMATLRAPQPR